MIRFACPQCGQSLRVANLSAGKKGRCPFCGSVVEIPAPGGRATGVTEAPPSVQQRRPPPVPPPTEADAEPELEHVGDPSHETDVLEAIPAGELERPGPVERWKAQFTRSGTPRSVPRRRPSQHVLLGTTAGAVLLAAAGALLTWRPWAQAPPRSTAPSREARPAPGTPMPTVHRPPVAPRQPTPRPRPIVTSAPTWPEADATSEPMDRPRPGAKAGQTKRTPPGSTAAPTGPVIFLCYNLHCPTRGWVFTIEPRQLPSKVLSAGTPMRCPR